MRQLVSPLVSLFCERHRSLYLDSYTRQGGCGCRKLRLSAPKIWGSQHVQSLLVGSIAHSTQTNELRLKLNTAALRNVHMPTVWPRLGARHGLHQYDLHIRLHALPVLSGAAPGWSSRPIVFGFWVQNILGCVSAAIAHGARRLTCSMRGRALREVQPPRSRVSKQSHSVWVRSPKPCMVQLSLLS